MANIAKNAILRAKIEGVLTDIMVKTTAGQVYVNENTTLAAHLATLAASADLQALQQTVNALGALAKKDKVSYADLEEALAALIDGKAEASALTEEINRAKAAEEAAVAAANKAQGDVDNLKTYVGIIPEGATATDIVGYVQEKTAGIATEGAMTELGNRVGVVEGKVATIEGDYLKAADKTELEGKITEANNAVATEKSRAEGIEAGLRTDINTVMGDYLKAADKTELQGNIDTVAGALETLTNGISADEIDGVNDLIKYVKDHGAEVITMQGDISDNASAIEGVAGRVTVVEGAVATKAEKSYVDEQVEALQGVDSGLDTRLKAVEDLMGDGEGSVSEQIEAAKQAAISAAAADATSKANAAQAAAEATAAADATSKANAAEQNAKGHADGLNTAMNTRVEALEAIDHDHANKAELDLIASGDKAKWDAASAKAHEHANKTVIDGITAEKVSAWDAAEGNAKGYADGLNNAMDARMQSVEALKHTHDNKTVLDGITANMVSAWNGKAKVYAANETVDLPEGEIFIQLI